MGDRVLFISSNETFSVNGIEKKLKENGIDYTHVSTNADEFEQHKNDANVYIFYLDENVETLSSLLVTLKYVCVEKDKSLLLIGTRSEYESVIRIIPEGSITEWFERPVYMDEFIRKVKANLTQAVETTDKKSILIVDDDITYMRTVRDWLKDDYQVSMAKSGMQAITWIARNHADLILLDYEMPSASGPQVLEMLRSEAGTDAIPVMFLTGKNDKESIMNVLALRPDDYLLKTIDRDKLLSKLDNYFKKHK